MRQPSFPFQNSPKFQPILVCIGVAKSKMRQPMRNGYNFSLLSVRGCGIWISRPWKLRWGRFIQIYSGSSGGLSLEKCIGIKSNKMRFHDVICHRLNLLHLWSYLGITTTNTEKLNLILENSSPLTGVAVAGITSGDAATGVTPTNHYVSNSNSLNLAQIDDIAGNYDGKC